MSNGPERRKYDLRGRSRDRLRARTNPRHQRQGAVVAGARGRVARAAWTCPRARGAASGKSTGRWWGASVVCLASGPSLTADDVERARRWRDAAPEERRAIAVNSTGLTAPWVDVLYAVDARWWRVYGDPAHESGRALRRFRGELWAGVAPNGQLDDEWARVHDDIRCRIRFIEVVKDGRGLSTQPGRINAGGNGGYQAIGLAYAWGARRVVLLGYDMQRTGGKTHHHGDHAGDLPNLGNLDEWRDKMNQLAIDLRKQGVAVQNATRVSALTCFDRVDADQALQ